MRRPVLLVVFSLLLAGMSALVVWRNVTARRAGATASATAASAGPGTAAAGAASASAGSGGPATGPARAPAKTPETGPAPPLHRSLRVATADWELAVPLVMAAGGLETRAGSPFAEDALDVRATVAPDVSAVENALVAGDDDPAGADVALLSLPLFVAAYERLRALDPEVFLVVGWSRGREVLVTDAPLAEEPRTAAATLRADRGTAPAFVGLFALEVLGWPPEKVALRAPGGALPPGVTADAWDRSGPSAPDPSRRTLLSTADATALVPYVAVATRSFVEKHPAALIAFGRGWTAGVGRLRADVPAAARALAAEKGAPAAVALLERLGRLEPATMHDNARLAGLAGRGAVTLEALFHLAWRLWRASGVLSGPAPERLPFDASIIGTLARGAAPPVPAAVTPAGDRPAAPAVELLVRRFPKGKVDPHAVVHEIGFLAGLFERSDLQVATGKDPKRAAALVAEAVDHFGLPPKRVTAVSAPDGATKLVVLAVP